MGDALIEAKGIEGAAAWLIEKQDAAEARTRETSSKVPLGLRTSEPALFLARRH
jgi:hypothetical protein